MLFYHCQVDNMGLRHQQAIIILILTTILIRIIFRCLKRQPVSPR